MIVALLSTFLVGSGAGGASPLKSGQESVPGGPPAIGTFSLLKDLVTFNNDASSEPRSFTVVGGTLFFVADTEEEGTELWKTDGTAAGTMLVKDIVPGPHGSSPQSLTAMGNTLFFTAWHPLTGTELWKTDGTTAGTTLVQELAPGPDSSDLDELTVSQGTLFFRRTLVAGSYEELWRSDGTAAGTLPVKDFNGLAGLVDMNGTLFFAASTLDAGRELWKSNGTPAGTTLVKDINPSGSSAPMLLTAAGNTLFFFAWGGAEGRELWKSDGTAAGTTLVKDINPGRGDSFNWSAYLMKAVGSRLFFIATAAGAGTSLYISDGSAEGTTPLKAFTTVYSHEPAVIGNTLYFAAMEPSTGYELWKSDGTAAGTRLVKDLAPGPGNSAPISLTPLGGQLYFGANFNSSAPLMRTDGTEAGTVVVSPEREGGLAVRHIAALGSQLLFSAAASAIGAELWRTDGTAAGTTLLMDVNPSRPSSDTREMVSIGNTLFLATGANTLSLFKSDGSAAGTVELYNPDPAEQGCCPSALTPMGSTLFFTLLNYPSGTGLYKSDGTSRGTRLVKILNPSLDYSFASQMTRSGSTLFFFFTRMQDTSLYKSDGTAEGTLIVKGFSPSPSAELVDVNGTLFLSARTREHGTELWRSDGTPAGTQVLDLVPGPGDSNPSSLVALGNTLYFFTSGARANGKLWRSDGTRAGTTVLKEFGAPTPLYLTRVGNRLFFTAGNTSVTGNELWVSDGTAAGTMLVKDIWPGRGGSDIRNIIDVNGVAYFGAVSPEAGYELWKSDGTAAGTVLVKDLWPGPESGLGWQPMLSLSPEGVLLFTATDGNLGLEPWRSDGTPEGTYLVQDIAPGAASSNPRLYTRMGALIFSTADDGKHGREPWVTQASDLWVGPQPPTGGGCTATSNPASLWGLLGVLLLAVRRRRASH